MQKSAFSTNAQSRFASVVVDRDLGPLGLSRPHLTVSLYICSSGSNARGESRALEGRRVSSKKRVQNRDEEVAGRNYRELCVPDGRSVDYSFPKVAPIILPFSARVEYPNVCLNTGIDVIRTPIKASYVHQL